MVETGRIREITGTTLILKREDRIACFGCMNQECKSKPALYKAENPWRLPLEVGQLVETELAASALKQGLAVLAPPFVGFIAGYFLTGIFLPAAGEPSRAAGGVLFLFAAALIIYFIRRRFPPGSVRRVTRVLEGEP